MTHGSAVSTTGASRLATTTAAPRVTVTTTEPIALQEVVVRVRADETLQNATLQVPPDPEGGSPVVVLLHGAGMEKGSLASMADAVVAMGIPVLNASWLADLTDPAMAGADAVCAVAYAYQNASSWEADSDRIVVMGHSGGGHVGMLAGLAPEAFPKCATAADAHVWAYIGLAGDPAAAAEGGSARGFWEHEPDLLGLMDSYNHIGGNLELIARFVHGTSDSTVSIRLTGAFHDALSTAGYDSELIPIDGANHSDPAIPTTDAGRAALHQLAELVRGAST